MKNEMSELVACLEQLHGSEKDLIIGPDGSVREAVALKGCVVSYVNCRTKKTEMVSLKPGETFGYGDWDGTRCVRKTFTC